MHVSLNIPDDTQFMQDVTVFLAHIALCPDCYKRAHNDEESEAIVYAMVDAINDIASTTVQMHDYAGAIEVCREWLAERGLTPKVDKYDFCEISTRQ